jgi:4-amino-4-deoxy-L-arabinose transferase-like glycosyltransferase
MSFIKTDRSSQFLLLYLIILIIPALFINLGLMPFILDEATRANVALEMLHSGNFITPTINGEFYYNKPPLFNWILIVFTKFIGNYSEFTFRLPVVLSLIFFGLSIYLTQRKELGKRVALLSALALISCGRILFYDSYKGLIDITFSWIIYLQFWSIFYFFKRKEFFKLFVYSYLFTTLAFLMKGLPALVFQAISLLAYFIERKSFKKLISMPHIAGVFTLLLIVGGYFLVYNHYNSLENYFDALWSESAKRTFIDNPILANIKHLFTFPFEFIYHFLPWSLFVLILFFKGSLKSIFRNDLSRFFSIIFLANIMVYWVSPAIYARYLFMFLPLFFGIVFFVFFNNEDILMARILKALFFFTGCMLIIGLIIFPVFISLENYSYFWLKYLLSIFLLVPLVVLYFRNKREWMFLFVGILLISRIAFNFFVLPDRLRTGTDEYQKNGAIIAGKLSGSEELYLLGNTRIQHVSTFYIMRERKQLLTRWGGAPSSSKLYIVEKEKSDGLPPHEVFFTFETRIEGLKLDLVQFSDTKN